MIIKIVNLLLLVCLLLAGCSTPAPSVNIFMPECENLVPLQESIISLSNENLPSDAEIEWVVSQGEIVQRDDSDNKMVVYIPNQPGNVNIKAIIMLSDSTYKTTEKNCVVRGPEIAAINTPSTAPLVISPTVLMPIITLTPSKTVLTPTPDASSITPLPTNTIEIQPTFTAIPTSEPAQSNVIISETFDSNYLGWPEPLKKMENAPHIVSKVVDGKYTHVISCPANYPAKYCGFYIPIPTAHAKDFRIEMDASIRMESSGGNPVKVGVGLWFRRQEENRYSIHFYDEGFYIMHLAQKGKNEVVLKVADAPDMNQSKNRTVTNRIGIDVKGNEFRPIVNETLYQSVYDPNNTYMEDGYFLIALFVSPGGSAWIDLDNLTITSNED